MNELSIFIDESRDFGEYSNISPYYIVALVIHHQEADISAQLQQLESSLAGLAFLSTVSMPGQSSGVRMNMRMRIYPQGRVY